MKSTDRITYTMIITYQQKQIAIEQNDHVRGIDVVRKHFPEQKEQILCISCDTELQSLNNIISSSISNCCFYDINDTLGAECLAVSTTALMLMAAEGLFPDTRISVEHSFGKGFYCEPVKLKTLPDNYLDLLKTKMDEYVKADHEFEERVITHDELNNIKLKRFNVLKNSPKDHLRIYDLCGFPHWFVSSLVPSAGYIKQFKITPYEKGFVLGFPTRTSPDMIPPFVSSPNLFRVIRESEERGKMLDIRHISDLNEHALEGRQMETIHLYEALHEKKIAEIADVITHRKKLRFIFIAGPSASGKTTFMKRLSLQLRINGLKPKHISLDDYFVNREHTPQDDKGEFDYEHFDAIDHELLNRNLIDLMNGKGVHLPRFLFQEGKKEYQENETFLLNDEILILEGIHGLNPGLASPIPDETKFRIYISALTQLNFNLYNRVSTSDTRLLRRMYRDSQFRGHSPEETLLRWPSVRRGEARWIFPHQENADIYFNSALEYEWPVFSGILLETLSSIPDTSPVKVEAERLCRLMELFVPFTTELIPPTSLIQEFLGGSSFVY
ncbi:MAG: nucleoside kinase [Candidatus Marinimicrobia bacterium]|nr:nucleoside kinase [Candidatus Neomarinimicrobiota bacterium]